MQYQKSAPIHEKFLARAIWCNIQWHNNFFSIQSKQSGRVTMSHYFVKFLTILKVLENKANTTTFQRKIWMKMISYFIA